MASGKTLLVVLLSSVYILFGVTVECCKEHETKPHEHDPNMFYICDHDRELRLFKCPNGLQFNPLKPGCENKEKKEHEGLIPLYEAGGHHIVGHPKEEMADKTSNSDYLRENHGENMNSENHKDSGVEVHPVDEVPKSDSNLEHHGESLHSETTDESEVKETPDTEHDEHFRKKRQSYDPETQEEKEIHGSSSGISDSHSIYEVDFSHPVEPEKHNYTKSDMESLLLQSLYYLLSTISESSYNNTDIYRENKTDAEHDHTWHQKRENVNPSEEHSFDDVHKEMGPAVHEDENDKIKTNEKEESSTYMDFSHIYKK